MKTRKLLMLALVLATFHPAAHADVHGFKENAKEAGRKIGHGAREAAHATADASKKVGHAVANTARHGYRATKDAFHHVAHKTKTGDKTASAGGSE
jgi:hypothetical protein